jgi:hypothetical protein
MNSPIRRPSTNRLQTVYKEACSPVVPRLQGEDGVLTAEQVAAIEEAIGRG